MNSKVKQSKGASHNVLDFYSTVTSTSYAAKEVTGQEIASKSQKSTGYSRNLVPYMAYDSSIDENLFFRSDRPLDSMYKVMFEKPHEKQSAITPLTGTMDNGFTRRGEKTTVNSSVSFRFPTVIPTHLRAFTKKTRKNMI